MGRPAHTGLALLLLSALGGCESSEVAEWKCVGPLVDLVRWRDELEVARTLGGRPIAAADLLQQEREHVATTVEAIRPRRTQCEMTWSVLMHQPPENPGLRLREEAILQVLGLPARDYGPDAVGWSGETVAGRRPVSGANAR